MIDVLKNKRVALVGPSQSMVGSGLGEVIDSYDIVVRVNKGIPIPKHLEKDIGSKTTILCSNLDGDPMSSGIIEPKLWKELGVGYVLFDLPPKYIKNPMNSNHIHRARTAANVNKIIPIINNTDVVFDKCLNALNAWPHTGFMALMYLLDSKLSELFLTGFTFYKDLPYEEYYHGKVDIKDVIKDIKGVDMAANSQRGNKTIQGHDNHSEFEYFKNVIYPNDSRLKIDKKLKSLLDE